MQEKVSFVQINNLTPVDVYFNRGKKILKKREAIKQKNLLQR